MKYVDWMSGEPVEKEWPEPPPDFADGWAIPLVALTTNGVAQWLVDHLNALAATPPASALPRDLHCDRCGERIELRHYDYPQHTRDHIPVLAATPPAPALDVERLARAILRAEFLGEDGLPPSRWDLYAGTVAAAIARAYAEEGT